MDGITLNHDKAGIQEFLKKYLVIEFEVKDLGALRCFFNMEFAKI